MKHISRKIHPWMWGILIFLILLLVISTLFFIRSSIQFRAGEGIHPRNPLMLFGSGGKQPIHNPTIQDIESLEGWMTFTYINKQFHLPNNLLKDTLSIDATRYPKISLDSYARSKKLDKTVFLNQVKDIIRKTLTENPNP